MGVRSSSRVQVLTEVKQREEQRLEIQKYTVAPFKISVPFKSLFRWSHGKIQSPRERWKNLEEPVQEEGKRIRKRVVRYVDERAARAKKRHNENDQSEESDWYTDSESVSGHQLILAIIVHHLNPT